MTLRVTIQEDTFKLRTGCVCFSIIHRELNTESLIDRPCTVVTDYKHLNMQTEQNIFIHLNTDLFFRTTMKGQHYLIFFPKI